MIQSDDQIEFKSFRDAFSIKNNQSDPIEQSEKMKTLFLFL
jgi:hypothetical protein